MSIIRIILLAALLLSGCASPSPESKYYALTPTLNQAMGSVPKSWSVGVGQVRIPDYLDRPQMVKRLHNGELAVSDFHRWGGSLEQNIMDVLAQNLSHALAMERVVTYPWSSPLQVGYQVDVVIRRFDAEEGGKVVLNAQWRLLDEQKSLLIGLKNENIEVPMENLDYADQVLAQNRALEILSRHLAQALLDTAASHGEKHETK